MSPFDNDNEKTSPFGLIGYLKQTRVPLPLSHIETRFRITGEVAVVEMDQVFEQTASKSLDVTYTFPLPATAAVYRCEMIINGRSIRAAVMEEFEAREVVAKKKAAGQRTALVESVRDNVFELQLGNTAPGDRIVIRLAYVESLERLVGQLSLRIPFCPGVRYIPGTALLRGNQGMGSCDDTDSVPDASRISPPRIVNGHPEAATLYLQGHMDEGEVAFSTICSPTHPVIFRKEKMAVLAELSGEEHVPDRDFVIRWEESMVEVDPTPGHWLAEHKNKAGKLERYAMLQVRAPKEAALPGGEEKPQDFYFLLDRSGSMEGMKWKKCAEALTSFVKEMGDLDKVWITCFESRFQDFSDRLHLRDELLADKEFQGFSKLGTLGGTELLPALEHVLETRNLLSEKDRRASIIIITDGQVGNDHEILKRMTKADAQGLTVHTFGIDTAVNDDLLKKLASKTGGRCVLMTPEDDIPAAVKRLAVAMRRPVLTQMKLEGKWLLPQGKKSLPDLHAGEVMVLPVRQSAAEQGRVVLTGARVDGSRWEQCFDLSQSGAGAATVAPRLLWVQQRCRFLLDNLESDAAVTLAVEHNILCKGTSFVAWDDAEKVPVAQTEVYQPAMEQARPLYSPAARFSSARGMPMMASMSAPPPMASVRYPGASHQSSKLSDDMEEELDVCLDPSWELLPKALQKLCTRLCEKHDLDSAGEELSAHGRQLSSWFDSFESLLVKKLAFHSSIAAALGQMLVIWATQLINSDRADQLQKLCKDLRSGDVAAQLLLFFSSQQKNVLIADAELLLREALKTKGSAQPGATALQDLGKE